MQSSYNLDAPSDDGLEEGAFSLGGQARITLGDHLAYPNDDGTKGPGYALIGGLLFRFAR